MWLVTSCTSRIYSCYCSCFSTDASCTGNKYSEVKVLQLLCCTQTDSKSGEIRIWSCKYTFALVLSFCSSGPAGNLCTERCCSYIPNIWKQVSMRRLTLQVNCKVQEMSTKQNNTGTGLWATESAPRFGLYMASLKQWHHLGGGAS